jgi:hypothetical protein
MSTTPIPPEQDYSENHHPPLSELRVGICYICSQPLKTERSPDHIIPDSFYLKGAGHRPKLPVHDECNNLKSKDDRWFLKQIALMASLDPRAEADLIAFLDKATKELPRAGLIGSRLPNYALARTLLDGVVEGMDIKHGNRVLTQFTQDPKSLARLDEYIRCLCRGLFMRNVPGAVPDLPEVKWINRDEEQVKGSYSGSEAMERVLAKGGDSLFHQKWGDHLAYYGIGLTENRNHGFIFVQFYRNLGAYALFGREQIEASRLTVRDTG